LGIFEYSDEFEQQILDKEIIPHADQKEIEIRAATIECVEQIKKEVKEIKPDLNLKS